MGGQRTTRTSLVSTWRRRIVPLHCSKYINVNAFSTGMYVAIPPKDANSKAEIMLLAFQPLADESQFTAQNHYEFIVWQLAEYGLSMKKLLCLIGDNCSTNSATAKLCKVLYSVAVAIVSIWLWRNIFIRTWEKRRSVWVSLCLSYPL